MTGNGKRKRDAEGKGAAQVGVKAVVGGIIIPAIRELF
jgi:hypothetical protein